MRPSAYDGSLLFNGSGRPLRLDAPAKTLPASMSGNNCPILDEDEVRYDADPWVVGYHARLRTGRKPNKAAPKRLRRLTLEESAALQTFPRDYIFYGPLVAQFRQVGNSVPPNLAYHVALSVLETLGHDSIAGTEALVASA